MVAPIKPNPRGTMATVAVRELSNVARLIDSARQTDTLCLLDWHQLRRYVFDTITDAAVEDGLLDDESNFPQKLPTEFYDGGKDQP